MRQTTTSAIDVQSAWNQSTPRQRLARLLLVRSNIDPAGNPDRNTLAAIGEGVGAFHGPPLLERRGDKGPSVAARFNAAIRTYGLERHALTPLVGGNAECGLAYTTGRGGTAVPFPAALGAAETSVSYDIGRIVGREFGACGYAWAFQPVVDVRTATGDPVIGVRAFGSDPAVVAERSAAYVAGMQSTGVMATAKHFPGHGDATVDSHLDLPVVDRSIEGHRDVHLPPFQAVIDAGVDSIMTAHVVLPAIDEDTITTFSAAVCTHLLREHMGFDGILVTDSLRMQAVARTHTYADAYVASLAAGCDVMNVRCWPAEVAGLLDELERRLTGGEIDESRLFSAFHRVVTAAARAPEPAGADTTRALPPESTTILDDHRLNRSLVTADPNGVLPLVLSSSSSLGVMVETPRGTDVPPSGLVETIGDLVGCPASRATTDLDRYDALLVVSYGQAGPTDAERILCERASASGRPSAALIGGTANAADAAGIELAHIVVPTIDVFSLPSITGLAMALHRLFTVRA